MDNPGSNKRIGAAAVAKYRVYKRERNKGCIKRYQKREFMVKILAEAKECIPSPRHDTNDGWQSTHVHSR
jgi:hypothetical protein